MKTLVIRNEHWDLQEKFLWKQPLNTNDRCRQMWMRRLLPRLPQPAIRIYIVGPLLTGQLEVSGGLLMQCEPCGEVHTFCRAGGAASHKINPLEEVRFFPSC